RARSCGSCSAWPVSGPRSPSIDRRRNEGMPCGRALPSRIARRTIAVFRAIVGPHPAPAVGGAARCRMTEETFPGADERPADAEFGDSRIPASDLDRANAENGFGGASVETADAAFDDASAAFLGETAEAPDGVTAPDQLAAPDDGSAFLANLASAMKEAATAERTRGTEDVDRRREAHLTGIETRRESEAANIRNRADEDRTAIQTWVESEQQRINEERDRRTAALETDLEASLAEHGARIDAE